MGIAPLIWRRVQTLDCTLADLHDLLQVTMGWEFEHLYRFIIGGVEYTDSDMARDDDVQDACETNLSAILPAHNRRPRFLYLYDFGDQWMHQLVVEERFSPEQGVTYPVCVAGQRACPPEDCGGPWAAGFVEGSVTRSSTRTKRCWNASVARRSREIDLEPVNMNFGVAQRKS
jgi:hypothetical protein